MGTTASGSSYLKFGKPLRIYVCIVEIDNTDHTLAECSVWLVEREALRVVVGQDLDLPSLISKILKSKEGCDAVRLFTSTVIGSKEAAEREEERRVLAFGEGD